MRINEVSFRVWNDVYFLHEGVRTTFRIGHGEGRPESTNGIVNMPGMRIIGEENAVERTAVVVIPYPANEISHGRGRLVIKEHTVAKAGRLRHIKESIRHFFHEHLVGNAVLATQGIGNGQGNIIPSVAIEYMSGVFQVRPVAVAEIPEVIGHDVGVNDIGVGIELRHLILTGRDPEELNINERLDKDLLDHGIRTSVQVSHNQLNLVGTRIAKDMGRILENGIILCAGGRITEVPFPGSDITTGGDVVELNLFTHTGSFPAKVGIRTIIDHHDPGNGSSTSGSVINRQFNKILSDRLENMGNIGAHRRHDGINTAITKVPYPHFQVAGIRSGKINELYRVISANTAHIGKVGQWCRIGIHLMNYRIAATGSIANDKAHVIIALTAEYMGRMLECRVILGTGSGITKVPVPAGHYP